MPYQTVFDVAEAGPEMAFVYFGAVFCTFGAILFVGFRHRLPPSASVGRPIFAWLFFGFSVFLTIVANVAVLGGHLSSVRRLEDGTSSVAEGVVEDFVPGPRGGHGDESFRVGDAHFAYGDAHMVSGFHQTSTAGGPMRAGIHVRIHHADGVILRLEIAEADLAMAPAPVSVGGPPPPWIVLVMFLIAPFGMYGMASVSGWSALARRYGTAAMVDGRAFVGVSMRLGGLGAYSSCVSVTVGRDACSFATSPPFHFFHPIVTVPWTAVRELFATKRLTGLEIALRLETGEEIRFYGGAAEGVELAYEQSRRRGA